MSNEIQEQEVDIVEEVQNELDKLRHRATMLGIEYHPRTSAETLRKKISEVLDNEEKVISTTVSKNDSRQELLQDNMRLVRLRITCMNPDKKDLPGEVITVANEIIGEASKFIPYGKESDEGYHVPYFIYKFLKTCKYQSIRRDKDRRTGRVITTSKELPEYNLEILPPLSAKELSDLAQAQIAAGSLD